MKTPDEVKRERRHLKDSKRKVVKTLHIKRRFQAATMKTENRQLISVSGTNEKFLVVHS